MADASFLPNNREKWEKCCSIFYTNQSCSRGDQCPFLHKTRQEVDPVSRPRGEEFFMGRVRTPKLCRYSLRGNCYNKERCPFVHDVAFFIANGENSEASTSSQPLSNTLANTLNFNNLWIGPFTIGISNCQLTPTPEAKVEETKPVEKETKPETKMEAAAAASSSSWVNAPEFVPKIYQQQQQQQQQKPKSYAEAVTPSEQRNENGNRRLCPFMNKDGICRNILDCNYIHGELCDMCERLVLHPFDEELRKKHRQECLEQHEKNMELSFAIARSKEKTCGVCFEVIMEKANGEQRFGILPNCNHCFCLTCIRKWRQARQFENKIIRACPECRVTSDFVCPSMYWVDTKEDKEKLIDDYKNALATKDCKYFKKGHGKCPFGNKCFYLHAFADGRKCDVGPPPRQRTHRGLGLGNTDIEEQVMLWDFLNERDPWNWLSDDFDTESDESDWSESMYD